MVSLPRPVASWGLVAWLSLQSSAASIAPQGEVRDATPMSVTLPSYSFSDLEPLGEPRPC